MPRGLLIQAMTAICLASASTACLPYVLCDSIEKSRELWDALAPHRKALEAKDVATLDRLFSVVLERYTRREITDADVSYAFGMFDRQDASRESMHESWVTAFPKSEAAHYSQAVYYAERGWAARGSDFSAKTDATQLAGMAQAFEKAWKALDAAEAVSKRPTLEWGTRIEMLKTSGQRGAQVSEDLYRKAVRSDPKAVRLRTVYIDANTPRWGGSFERLAQIAADARTLDAADRRYVEYWATFHAGRDHELYEHDDIAVDLYERAMPLCPGLGQAAGGAMRVYQKKKDWAALQRAASRYVAARPQEGWGWATRAYAYGMLNDLEKSFKDYEHAMQLGYAHAYEGLAWFYEAGQGGVRRDFAKAIDLHMAAHEKGVAGAKDRADKLRARTGLK